MQLVVFSGLPGAGKSKLAEAVGRHFGIPVFAKDWLEAALKIHGVETVLDFSGQQQSTGYLGYELLTLLASRQLQLDQSVILDSVASTLQIRDQWRKLALQHGAQWCVIECICSDEELHRGRLENRDRGIPGWHELTWAEVEHVKSYYAPWDDDHLVIDAVQPFEGNLEAVLAYLQE